MKKVLIVTDDGESIVIPSVVKVEYHQDSDEVIISMQMPKLLMTTDGADFSDDQKILADKVKKND